MATGVDWFDGTEASCICQLWETIVVVRSLLVHIAQIMLQICRLVLETGLLGVHQSVRRRVLNRLEMILHAMPLHRSAIHSVGLIHA